MDVGAIVAAGATVSVGRIGMSVGGGVVVEHANNAAASAANGIQVFMSVFSLSVWAIVFSGVCDPRVSLVSNTHTSKVGSLIVKRGHCDREVMVIWLRTDEYHFPLPIKCDQGSPASISNKMPKSHNQSAT